MPVPIQIVYGGMKTGAAGLGWDVPLSYIQQRRTFAHRRPSYVGNALPQPRQRTFIALLGQEVELMPRGGDWAARMGTLELIVRQSSGTWVAFDGSGRTYRFIQPPQFTNTGLWLLKSIEAAGGASVELTYQLNSGPIDGGSTFEVNVVGAVYNRHPVTGCAKHEIVLTYGAPAARALALTMIGETALARYRTVTRVDVMSRATCNTVRQRLRRYEFAYAPDSDTKLPRLQNARVFGRQVYA